jgi:hypothetical protein
MGTLDILWMRSRLTRHLLFWLAWITGFTFVKSYGAGPDVYLAWFVYYITTLPVFVLHTYLVVYWAAPRFLSGLKILVFVGLFFVFMVLFSFVEMLITVELLSGIFPGTFSAEQLYMRPEEVVISGIGNIYIILVFAASKMIRTWHLKERRREEMIHRNLLYERADVNVMFQPRMLLFSLDQIERHALRNPETVPPLIIQLSELLQAIMRSGVHQQIIAEEELKNVRKLLKLYAMLFNEKEPVVEVFFEEPRAQYLAKSIVFLPLEVLFRTFSWVPREKLLIEVRSGDCLELSWEPKKGGPVDQAMSCLLAELEALSQGRITAEYLSHSSKLAVHSISLG